MSKQNANLIPPPKNKRQFNKLIKKGQNFYKKQEYNEALKYLTSAWKFDDSDTNLLIMIADSLFKKGNKSAALQLMGHTLERAPKDPNIASVLGNAALKMDMFDLSLRFHQKYIELRPNDVVGYNNYASALREDGKLDEAIEFLQDIIPLFAQEETIWNTLASIVSYRDGPEAAIIFYEECLKLNPENSQALNNVAPAYLSVNKPELAEETIKKAIKLSPNLLDPHLFLSNLYLISKRLSDGWNKYSMRSAPKHLKITAKHNKIPVWQGEELKGKKIIVFSEQGIGDEILFSCLYNEIIEQAKEATFSCEGRLVELFKASFPAAQVAQTRFIINYELDYSIMVCPDVDFSDYDYQCVAGDLMKYFWKKYEDIKPSSTAILKPPQEKIDRWKKEIEKLPHKLSVGIAWRSGLRLARRSRSYAQLTEWAHFFKDKEINLVNVQYGDCDEEIEELESKTGLKVHQIKGLDLKDDFSSTTAMMQSLDLVVGPSTSPVHQAAFSGTEVWYFSSGQPWWSFGDEIPVWRQNSRIILKNENDLWGDFLQEQSQEFDKWYQEKLG